jgi:hypothetical protein
MFILLVIVFATKCPEIKSKNAYNPHVLNTTVDGQPGYATRDLLLRHPTEKDRYCVYGRLDDQLMLTTGEKVMSNVCQK